MWWDENVTDRTTTDAARGEDGRRGRGGRSTRTKERASHSLESVLAEAVAILDESGAQGLTIRALATRLGGGAASIYWYVSGREELLDLAADSVLAGVLEAVADVHSDNYNEVIAARTEIGIRIFEEMTKGGYDFAYPTQTSFTAAPDGTMVLPYAESPDTHAPAPKAKKPD